MPYSRSHASAKRSFAALIASGVLLAVIHPIAAHAQGQRSCTMSGGRCSYATSFSGSITWTRTYALSSGSSTVNSQATVTATVDSGRVMCSGSSSSYEKVVTSGGRYSVSNGVGSIAGPGLISVPLQKAGVAAGGKYAIIVECPVGQQTTTMTRYEDGAATRSETKPGASIWASTGSARQSIDGTASDYAVLEGDTTKTEGGYEDGGEKSSPIFTRVQWRLTSGPVKPSVAAVVVSIEGPACACLDGEKVPGAQVSWSASASQGGGTFGPFTVRTAGSAPKVVSNSGGVTGARITLEPTRATQAVTLTATYTHKGRALTATHNVDFCVFDSTRIGDGLRDFAFDDASPGKLEITARSRAVYNGADVSAELAWEFEPIGGASTTTMTPANPTGGVVDVTYTGLPEFNAAFGKKRIEVSLDKGACACKRTDSFRAFYSPTATNHPPPPLGIAQGTSPVPNWFYYYAQTPAIAGVPGVLYAPKLFSRGSNLPVIGQFDESDGNIYLTDQLWQTFCRPSVPQGGKPVAPPSGAGNEGIDCVAGTVRHEAQHRADRAVWWPNGYLVPADLDTDGVPLLVEAARPGCSPISKASCDERPFTDVEDLEINAYWVGWRWQTGSINAQDWACGAKGKQWKGGYGCAP